MISQTFTRTTAITNIATEVFNSETHGGLNVENSVYAGMSIKNTGSAVAQIQVDIKMHPNGAWITQSAMGTATYAASNTTQFSNSFYRQIAFLSAGTVAANGTSFLSASMKFVYAIRVLSRQSTGTSGNSIAINGNVKLPTNFFYIENPVQIITAGTVNSSSVPTFFDVSEHAYVSGCMIASGTNNIANIAGGTFPGYPSTSSGQLLAVRYYPGDSYIYYDAIAGSSVVLGGLKTSLVVEGTTVITSKRQAFQRFVVEAAYEMGVLWNIPGGSTISYYVSMNG